MSGHGNNLYAAWFQSVRDREWGHSRSHSLKFPTLLERDNKRALAKGSNLSPKKRLKTKTWSAPLKASFDATYDEDDSWIDNFSSLDSTTPESLLQDQSTATIAENVIKKALLEVVSSLPPFEDVVQSQSTDDSVGEHCLQAPLVDRASSPSTPNQGASIRDSFYLGNGKLKLDYSNSNNQGTSSGCLARCTEGVLKKGEDRVLLTLTSFPFRIVHVNNSFEDFTGKKNLVGKTFFDAFVSQGAIRPSLVQFPTSLEKFQNQMVRVPTIETRQDAFCHIDVFPVTKKDKMGGLRYYAVKLNELKTHPKNATSLVYQSIP